MSKWIETTVGQATKFQRAGGTPTATNREYYGGKIPFVIIEDITNSSRYLEQTEKSLTEKGLRNSAAWLLTKPYILYSMYATVGKPVINKINCATNQAIIALEEAEHLDQLFLYYQLLLIRPQVYKYTAQTTQSNLNAGTVKKLIISYPQDKRAQQKISRILTSIDDTIEKTEALIHKYQQIKVGLMHDLFTRGVTADGKLRPPRKQAPELYKETPIGWIPKEWEVILLNELATYQHGRPFPSTDYSDEGVLLLRPGNLHISGIVRFDEAHTTRIPNRWLFDCPSFVLKPNDIVMNLTAQSLEDQFLGRVCLNVGEEPALLNQRIARFKAHAVEHGFLYWILRSHQFRKQIEHTTQGTKVQHLYNSDLNRVLLGVPREIEEQNNISNLLKISTNKVQTNIVHHHC